jgi:hypothetical protein
LVARRQPEIDDGAAGAARKQDWHAIWRSLH